jgi:hypothetical protein
MDIVPPPKVLNISLIKKERKKEMNDIEIIIKNFEDIDLYIKKFLEKSQQFYVAYKENDPAIKYSKRDIKYKHTLYSNYYEFYNKINKLKFNKLFFDMSNFNYQIIRKNKRLLKFKSLKLNDSLNMFPIDLTIEYFTVNDVKVVNHLICKNLEIYFDNITQIDNNINKSETDNDSYIIQKIKENRNGVVESFKFMTKHQLTSSYSFIEELKTCCENLDK